MANEKLLGDQVEKILKKVNADKAAKVYERVTKRDCGCKKRKEFLNKMHKHMQQMRDRIIEQQLQNQKRK